MNIYIKIEVKNRELEARLLLALAAAERGHVVLLGPKSLTIDSVMKDQLNPGIIHDKSITPGKPRIRELQLYKEKGFLFTSIDEEGGIINKDYTSFAKVRFSNQTLDLATRNFSWGKFDHDGINNNFPGFSSKVIITGNPRIDLLRNDFSDYYLRQDVSKFENYILISSNFCGPLSHDKMWERISYQREKGLYKRKGNDAEFNAYLIESNLVKLVAYFVNAIKSISNQYPKIPIIIRPHPWENEVAWAGILGDISNVHIIKKGGSNKWIKNASIVIHNSCTTGIESVISGIPTIAYCPEELFYENNIPNDVSLVEFNEQNLLESIGYILKNKKFPERYNHNKTKEIIKNRFDNLDGPLAADRIVDEWEKMDNGNLSKPNNYFKVKIIANFYVFRRMLGKLRNFFYPNLSNRRIKIDPITKHELLSIINGFKSTLKRFDDLDIEIIGDRHILLRKKNL